MYYSAIGVLAVLILVIVNWDILYGFRISYDKPAWNVYRRFLFVVLAYYITDILWGILESQKLATALFVDTTVYFVAMAVGISFWAEYTVAYLEAKTSFGRLLVYAGRVICGLITIVTVINIFTPVLFKVDEECVYTALPTRYIFLVCQILMLLTISLYALSLKFWTDDPGGNRNRYRILAAFGLIMALCLFAQLWFPYLPLYSIAYMLGTSLLHSFVASDEKEEHNRKQKEAEKNSELKNRFASLLDNVPGMTFTKDAKTGVYLACNQEFADYAHKDTPEGVVGCNDFQLFDAETAAHILEDDKTALSLTKPYIFYEESLDAAGNPRQLQTTKLKYTDMMGRLCVLGMCQDVTDLTRIQHEHAMTKEAYERAVSSSLMYNNIARTLARDYIDMYYVDGNTEEYIEYRVSEEEKTLSEVRRGWHFFSDCKNELAEAVFPEDRDAFLRAMKRKNLMKALGRNDTFVMTYRVSDASGPVYVNMKISRMSDDEENPYIIMGITNVDAEMRETMAKNEALTKALSSAEQANLDRAAFLSSMSHDIRSPINAIIGLETLALKNEQMDGKTRNYLEKIGDSARKLLHVVDHIHKINQGDSGEVPEEETGVSENPETHSSNRSHRNEINPDGLNILVVDDDPIEAEYAKTVLEEVGLKVDCCTGGLEALHKIEAHHVRREPYNLVLMDWNMPGMSGGETSAEIRKLYSDECTIVALTAYNWKDIAVEANCVGVDSFLSKPLFASNIIEKLEEIAVRSHLPIFKEKKRAKLTGRRILLAEDVDINAEIMTESLEIDGIKVDHAENGKDAVTLFEKSTAGIYAAILMDVRMPEMDGLEATKIIRAMDREDAKKIPIVALTGNAFDEDAVFSMQAGMNAHLTKPVDMDQLLRILGELVYEAES